MGSSGGDGSTRPGPLATIARPNRRPPPSPPGARDRRTNPATAPGTRPRSDGRGARRRRPRAGGVRWRPRWSRVRLPFVLEQHRHRLVDAATLVVIELQSAVAKGRGDEQPHHVSLVRVGDAVSRPPPQVPQALLADARGVWWCAHRLSRLERLSFATG